MGSNFIAPSISTKYDRKNKDFWNRVPFYWKRAGLIQRLYIGTAFEVWIGVVVASVIMGCVGVALMIAQSLWFSLMLLPVLLLAIPYGLITLVVSRHRPLNANEFNYLRADGYCELNNKNRRKLKKMAKAVRSTPSHPLSEGFGDIVMDYYLNQVTHLKVPKRLQSLHDAELKRIADSKFEKRELEARKTIMKCIEDKTEPPQYDEEWNVVEKS